MNKESSKIIKFTDLIAWQEGHKLVLMIYKMIDGLPKEERYCLADQMRRAVVSITSCIAEGFTRQSSKEKIQLYKVSQGSLVELQNQLLVARDVSHINKEEFTIIADQTIVVHKLLIGLIRASKLKKYES